ncbi:MAG: Spy/CpxP family protein refolding chaperone [Halanaerobiales bacterium]
MKKLVLTLLVTALLVALSAGVTMALGPQACKGMGSAGRQVNNFSQNRSQGMGLFQDELSDSQIDEAADLREDFYNSTSDLRDERRDLNHEIRNLEFRGASNAEIGEVEDKLEEIEAEFEAKREEHIAEMQSILTDEQLESIEEFQSEHCRRLDGDFVKGARNHSANNKSGRRMNRK